MKKNRAAIEKTIKKKSRKVILVFEVLRLGPKGEIEKLADEYHLTKIDALNCEDCQLGENGKYLEADPNQELCFLSPSTIDSSGYVKNLMVREGLPRELLGNF